MTVAAYDWSPALSMMGLGALLALLPLLWVWRRYRQASDLQRYQAVMRLTLFLTLDLVLFGAFTRLTDSGLGCPDWPGCYGWASPLGAADHIATAQSLMPSGPVTHGKAWIEMLHRYLATAVGALIVLLTVWAWLWRWRRVPQQTLWNPWWPTLTLVWVCLQGAFGAWTVTMRLFPAVVTLHLLGGMALLAFLCVQVVRLAQITAGTTAVMVSRALRVWMVLALVLLTVQIALGGWVSTNYAVLACSDFPQCQGSWWPTMNFAQGFEVWRSLGVTGQGEPLDFAALTAIHFVHRSAAIVVVLSLGVLAWWLNRVPALRVASRWLAALLGLQLCTGLANVVLSWPLLSAVLHTGGAAALVLVLTGALAASQTARAATPQQVL
jgi:cytochrome c oxidase assembly protein subunit 15